MEKVHQDFQLRVLLLEHAAWLAPGTAAELLKTTARAEPKAVVQVLDKALAPVQLSEPVQHYIRNRAIRVQQGDFLWAQARPEWYAAIDEWVGKVNPSGDVTLKEASFSEKDNSSCHHHNETTLASDETANQSTILEETLHSFLHQQDTVAPPSILRLHAVNVHRFCERYPSMSSSWSALIQANRSEAFSTLTMRVLVAYKWHLVKRRFGSSFLGYLLALVSLILWTSITTGQFQTETIQQRVLAIVVLFFVVLDGFNEMTQLIEALVAASKWGHYTIKPFLSTHSHRSSSEICAASECRQNCLLYFSSIFSVTEIFRLSFFILGIVPALIHAKEQLSDIERLFMIIGTLLHWFGILRYLQAFSTTGPFVRMILAVISSTLMFLALVALLILGQAHALFISVPRIDGNDDGAYGSPGRAIYSSFSLALLSNYEMDTFLNAQQQTASLLIFSFGAVVCTVMFLNLLVAILSDTYERIQDRAYMEQILLQARLVERVERSSLSRVLRFWHMVAARVTGIFNREFKSTRAFRHRHYPKGSKRTFERAEWFRDAMDEDYKVGDESKDVQYSIGFCVAVFLAAPFCWLLTDDGTKKFISAFDGYFEDVLNHYESNKSHSGKYILVGIPAHADVQDRARPGWEGLLHDIKGHIGHGKDGVSILTVSYKFFLA